MLGNFFPCKPMGFNSSNVILFFYGGITISFYQTAEPCGCLGVGIKRAYLDWCPAEASPGDMDTSVGSALRHFIPIHGNLNRLVQLNLSTSIAEYNPRLTDCGRKIERLFTFVEHFDGAL